MPIFSITRREPIFVANVQATIFSTNEFATGQPGVYRCHLIAKFIISPYGCNII